jgi:prefoldin subunit 5
MSKPDNSNLYADRLAILRSVDIFSQTSSQYLAEAVDLLQEVDVPVGETIIHKGDLGQLARVFQRKIGEVYNREQRLKQEVAELKIEIDQVKQDRQVAGRLAQ